MHTTDNHTTDEVANSLSLGGAVSLGTGVMIGAGIFALTGQVAELAGDLFPIAFLVAAVIVGFSAYSYVKLSAAFPSSGGVAMFLFYLIMDIGVHWGILRRLRSRINARLSIVATAIVLDIVVLAVFLWVKASTDSLILYISAAGIAVIVVGERLFMRSHTDRFGKMDM